MNSIDIPKKGMREYLEKIGEYDSMWGDYREKETDVDENRT